MYRRAIELGCEIGIHTTNHSDLTKLTSEELDTVIYDAADKIETLTGKRPTLLRPPYGALTQMCIRDRNTAELGSFRIVKEQASSAGVRRIKAVIEGCE